MKQGRPLQRKTPLKAKKPMRRGPSTMKRGTPLANGESPLKTQGPHANGGGGKTQKAAPKLKRDHGSRSGRKRLRNKPTRMTPEERQTRKIVDARSDGFCEKCGTPGATDKAHRISRGVGGEWCPTNILDLCRDCHSSNHANPTRAYRGGWHLRSNSAPRDSRVWFHHEGIFGWAYLHQDGTYTWAEEVGITA